MKKQTIHRSDVPITPEFRQKTHRDIWYSIATAIIVTAIIIIIIIEFWLR